MTEPLSPKKVVLTSETIVPSLKQEDLLALESYLLRGLYWGEVLDSFLFSFKML